MQKKKLSTTLVVALVALVVVGIFANGTQIFKNAGVELGKKESAPTEMQGQELSDAERAQQREALKSARQNRNQTVASGVPAKPLLLIEPEVTNFKQAYNASATASHWYMEDSYVEVQRKKTEAQRTGTN